MKMTGWKTWTGVVGLLIVKISEVYLGVDMDAASGQADSLLQVVQAVFGALTVIGVSHKIEKSK